MRRRPGSDRVSPGPGQESVWDYPRPPRVERSAAVVVVRLGGVVIVESSQARRVLETSHPPVFYLPVQDVVPGTLQESRRTSYCEFKGAARYYTVVGGDRVEPDAAWWYPAPAPGFADLLDTVAFYPGRMDSCTVNGEAVLAQPGDFYGGWITSAVVGPFKGGAGTRGW